MIAVCDSSFDDDEMAYLSYFNLVHAFHTIASSTSLSAVQKARIQPLIDDLWEHMNIGLELSHNYIQMEKSSVYNFIYCYATGQVNRTRHTHKKNSTNRLWKLLGMIAILYQMMVCGICGVSHWN
jgi:hypothetical protein